MISYSDIKKGSQIILDDQPYEIIEASRMFKGRGQSILQARIKNLISGNILSYTFRPGEQFEKPELEKFEAKFLYAHREKYVFSEKENPSKRFELTKEQIGKIAKFLKTNQIVEGIIFNKEIINISLPIKVQLKVKESPPGVKGDRAQGGTKTVVLETGAEINAPLFIKEGDIVEINTETGLYVRRMEKE